MVFTGHNKKRGLRKNRVWTNYASRECSKNGEVGSRRGKWGERESQEV